MTPPTVAPSRRRTWVLAVLLVALLAGHGSILYLLSTRLVLSISVLAGVIGLLVLKHIGFLGPLSAHFRRQPQDDGRDEEDR